MWSHGVPQQRCFSVARVLVGALLVVIATSMCLRGEAQATTIVVAQDGTGDFRTITEGTNRLASFTRSGTLVVKSGFYDESVELRSDQIWRPTHSLVCPAGPQQTRVREITVATDGARWQVDGLAVQEHVLEMPQARPLVQWAECIFEKGYTAESRFDDRPHMVDCEFRGRTRLHRFAGWRGRTFTGLRFVGATLDVASSAVGSLLLEDCRFEGPVDTAVVASFYGDASVSFRNCTFKDANYGIAPPAVNWRDEHLLVDSCSFENIKVAAIKYRYFLRVLEDPWEGEQYPLTFEVRNTRFVNCARAIDWFTSESDLAQHKIFDSYVAGCSDTAIAMSGPLAAKGLTIEENAGPGLVVRGVYDFLAPVHGPTWLDSLTIRRNGGDGLVITEQEPARHLFTSHVRYSNISENGGTGLRVNAQRYRLEFNLLSGNAGHGLHFEQALGRDNEFQVFSDSIGGNTSVLNGGNGLLIEIPKGQMEGNGAVVRNNLVAGNQQVGLKVVGDPVEPVVANDAWLNTAGNYAGFDAADNTEVDPRFCNVYNHDYTVQETSPCAPSGPFGQIGAFGVGCTSSHVELMALRGNGAQPPSAAGQFKVGLLGHRLLDASSVDLASVRLGGAPPSTHAGNQQGMQFRDVNGDGIVDGVVAFRGDEMAVTVGGEAAFAGLTVDGVALSGGIEVREVGRGGEAEPLVAGGELPLAIRSIAPNPSRGAFIVEFSSPGGAPVTFEIFDVAGRRVKSAELGSARGTRRLEVRGLTSGMYFAVVKVGSESVRGRVVVR